MPSTSDEDSAAVVRDYLLAHPDFFARYPDVLEALDLPHACGGAVSLIERQVDALRERSRLLEARLGDLVANARHNERLSLRLHRLIREIISADSLGDVLALTCDCLQQHFRADSVCVVLLEHGSVVFDDLPSDVSVAVAPQDRRLEPFEPCFESGRTRCGAADAAVTALIPSSVDWTAQSAAVVPLVGRERYGLLMLGSREATRFAEDAGVLFLDQLGEVLGRRLASFPIAV